MLEKFGWTSLQVKLSSGASDLIYRGNRFKNSK